MEEFQQLMEKGNLKNSVCLDQMNENLMISRDPIFNCSIDLNKSISPNYDVSHYC